MNQKTFVLLAISSLFSACSSVFSVTSIAANESFVLGNNAHGYFNVKLKNLSAHPITVYQKTLTDSIHSFSVIKSKETVHVYADKNTALIIENKSEDPASVKLDLGGDVKLSMGYKN
ncbi:MAG: hypothetical protein HYZ44_07680 [Bacteroidetes bacterium]|nr:hypothetical protein [Bacteroidota bacterium]